MTVDVGGAQGVQGVRAAGPGLRAAVNAWLEEISFRAGVITAAIGLVVLVGIVTAGVLAAGLGTGTQQADASPVITRGTASATASAPLAAQPSAPAPTPSSTPKATQSPVTADTTAPLASAAPQPTTEAAAAGQDSGSTATHESGLRTSGIRGRGQQFGFGSGFGPGSGHQGGMMRFGGFGRP
jgi:hypothetical protein